MSYKLGVIGAGKMGEAILTGALKNGLYKPEEVIVSVKSEKHRLDIEKRLGVTATLDNQAVADSELIVLAVKPKNVAEVASEISGAVAPAATLVSVAAGVAAEIIETRVPSSVAVIRSMPNIAVSVGEGMTVLSPGKNASQSQIQLASRLFDAVGRSVVLDERYMDAVTGLSGSGIAYIFLIVEAMADGGVKLGLPKDVAIQLAAQTLLGAAKMVLVTGEHPAKLKDLVTTPAGTTIEGLLALEEGGLRATLIRAVVKSAERSKQLLQTK